MTRLQHVFAIRRFKLNWQFRLHYDCSGAVQFIYYVSPINGPTYSSLNNLTWFNRFPHICILNSTPFPFASSRQLQPQIENYSPTSTQVFEPTRTSYTITFRHTLTPSRMNMPAANTTIMIIILLGEGKCLHHKSQAWQASRQPSEGKS